MTARDPGQEIKLKYGTIQIPESYIIDRNGKVVEKIVRQTTGLRADGPACPVPPLKRGHLARRIAAARPAKKQIVDLAGPRGYLDRPEDLTLYEYDGSVDKARPDLVVFPRTTEDVAAIVKIAAEHGIPIVGRGAGTGLERRRDSARGRHDDRLLAHEPHSRNRSRERARGACSRAW